MATRSFNHIPAEIIDEVRQRNDIAEVIMECGVPLKLSGKNYKACCPFHDEKTPSLPYHPKSRCFIALDARWEGIL